MRGPRSAPGRTGPRGTRLQPQPPRVQHRFQRGQARGRQRHPDPVSGDAPLLPSAWPAPHTRPATKPPRPTVLGPQSTRAGAPRPATGSLRAVILPPSLPTWEGSGGSIGDHREGPLGATALVGRGGTRWNPRPSHSTTSTRTFQAQTHHKRVEILQRVPDSSSTPSPVSPSLSKLCSRHQPPHPPS